MLYQKAIVWGISQNGEKSSKYNHSIGKIVVKGSLPFPYSAHSETGGTSSGDAYRLSECNFSSDGDILGDKPGDTFRVS